MRSTVTNNTDNGVMYCLTTPYTTLYPRPHNISLVFARITWVAWQRVRGGELNPLLSCPRPRHY